MALHLRASGWAQRSTLCGVTRVARAPRASLLPPPRAAVTVSDYSTAGHRKGGPELNVEIHADENSMAYALVASVEAAAVAAIAEKGVFTIAIPGGSVLQYLKGLAFSEAGIDWTKVRLAYVNHKAVPIADKSSTHKKACDFFLDAVGIPAANVLAMSGTDNAVAEAVLYEAGLKKFFTTPHGGCPPLPVFDLMLIGMGGDGHVGSLYPGRPETTADCHAWVLPVVKDKPPASITLSAKVMSAAKSVVICCTGAKKAATVQACLEEKQHPGSLPAQMVAPGPGSKLTWLLDAAAASQLQAAKGVSALL